MVICLPVRTGRAGIAGIAGRAGGAGRAGIVICLPVITKLSSRAMTGMGGALGQTTGKSVEPCPPVISSRVRTTGITPALARRGRARREI